MSIQMIGADKEEQQQRARRDRTATRLIDAGSLISRADDPPRRASEAVPRTAVAA